jgi:hypothetical protein
MRAEIVDADRRLEVRRAATLWRKAGEIDEAAERRIAELYADDRVRTTRVFRVLFFFFTWFGLTSAWGLFSAFLTGALGLAGTRGALTVLSFLTGLAALGAAELLHTHRKLRRFGVEEACVWIGVSLTVGSAIRAFDRLFDPSISWALGLGAWGFAAAATLAAWRWGTPWTGYLAAGGLFVALTQLPASHFAWTVAAFLLVWPLGHLSIAAHISPEGRRRFREAFWVASAAAYFAIHVDVVEERLLRKLRVGVFADGEPLAPALDWWIAASWVAMIGLPLLYVAAGVARRMRPALDLGLLMLLATIATFAFRTRPQPEWLVLLAAGATLLGLAFGVRRILAKRPGSEWAGLTSLPLAEDRESAGALETIAGLAAFAPAARPLEPREGFEGRGGDFGGGGASASF